MTVHMLNNKGKYVSVKTVVDGDKKKNNDNAKDDSLAPEKISTNKSGGVTVKTEAFLDDYQDKKVTKKIVVRPEEKEEQKEKKEKLMKNKATDKKEILTNKSVLDTEDVSLFEEAVSAWGVEAQLDMCVEESAELINAIAKLKRDRVTITDVMEEAVDVFIMLAQLMVIYKEVEGEDAAIEAVNDIYRYKTSRMAHRLAKRRK